MHLDHLALLRANQFPFRAMLVLMGEGGHPHMAFGVRPDVGQGCRAVALASQVPLDPVVAAKVLREVFSEEELVVLAGGLP